jgi:ATP-dependent DNA helicase RecG
VVELVEAAGQINARMVRVTLEVDAPTASRLLAGLVERGVLVRTSDARRGPSVTYGPGLAFPTRRVRSSDQRARHKPAGR